MKVPDPYFALPRYVRFRAELPTLAGGPGAQARPAGRGVTPATWDADAAGIGYDKR